jgi:glycosyltransferase involved in cell wall biosynthesis
MGPGPGEGIRTSVVIAAYRAWATLPAVLDALEPKLGADREAILVDSGTEGERRAQARWPWLRVISLPERLLPGAARNLGVTHARGRLLAFLDADAVPSPNWLERLEGALAPGIDAVAGAIANGTPESGVGTAEYLLTCSETFRGRARPPRHGLGANLLIRRERFAAAGGFCESLRAAEDSLLTFPIAARGRLAFAPEAIVVHINRTELGPFLANQRAQGAAFVGLCRRVGYPHRWVVRGPALALAGPLRLLALARWLAHNPKLWRDALRSLPYLVLGTVAWVLGAHRARGQVT